MSTQEKLIADVVAAAARVERATEANTTAFAQMKAAKHAQYEAREALLSHIDELVNKALAAKAEEVC